MGATRKANRKNHNNERSMLLTQVSTIAERTRILTDESLPRIEKKVDGVVIDLSDQKINLAILKTEVDLQMTRFKEHVIDKKIASRENMKKVLAIVGLISAALVGSFPYIMALLGIY